MPRNPTSAADRQSSTICENCVEKPGIDLRQLVKLIDATTRDRARGRPPTSGDRSGCSAPAGAPPRLPRDAGSSAGRLPGWSISDPLEPISSERKAFMNASLNVRPIAMTSPTDFICVVRVRSACGNFSNAHRGTFTTT